MNFTKNHQVDSGAFRRPISGRLDPSWLDQPQVQRQDESQIPSFYGFRGFLSHGADAVASGADDCPGFRANFIEVCGALPAERASLYGISEHRSIGQMMRNALCASLPGQ
jgi:hypothetical protein